MYIRIFLLQKLKIQMCIVVKLKSALSVSVVTISLYYHVFDVSGHMHLRSLTQAVSSTLLGQTMELKWPAHVAMAMLSLDMLLKGWNSVVTCVFVASARNGRRHDRVIFKVLHLNFTWC